MTVVLPKDIEEWARGEVAAGRARSVDELVTRELRRARDMQAADVAALLDEGRADIAAGRAIDGEGLVRDLRARADELRRSAR